MNIQTSSKRALLSTIFGSCIMATGAVASAQSTVGDLNAPIPNGQSSYVGNSYSTSSSPNISADPAAPMSGAFSSRPALAAASPALHPFSAVAVTFKLGSGGIGFDVATPLARHFGLRSGASFFSYNTTLTEDGMNITGAIKFQGASTSLDIYPFRNNSFRISPGIAYANNNNLNANILVPGGQTFSFGDGGNYYSDPSDPIHGTASFSLGHTIAPRITMGFANIIPRKGETRFSFPFEVGFQYVDQPTVKLNITGTSCGSQTEANGTVDSGCGPVDQTNVAQEQTQLQNDLSPLRFYPIVSFGVSVRFGHMHQQE
jgi:hypothetical protein